MVRAGGLAGFHKPGFPQASQDRQELRRMRERFFCYTNNCMMKRIVAILILLATAVAMFVVLNLLMRLFFIQLEGSTT